MYVLGINASPRIGGNTDILLDNALKGARSAGAKTEKIALGRLKFSPCQECENMPSDGSCLINDDMQGAYLKIKNADAIIFASPIFFGSLSAQAKAMIDRFQCAWRGKVIFKKDIFADKKRLGAFISPEASERKDFFGNAKAIVKNFFAVINAEYKEELFCPGVDDKGAVSKHQNYLEKAAELGKRITSLKT